MADGATLCIPAHLFLCMGAPNHELPAAMASRAPWGCLAFAAVSSEALHNGLMPAGMATTRRSTQAEKLFERQV